jgi:hypothetical protein
MTLQAPSTPPSPCPPPPSSDQISTHHGTFQREVSQSCTADAVVGAKVARLVGGDGSVEQWDAARRSTRGGVSRGASRASQRDGRGRGSIVRLAARITARRTPSVTPRTPPGQGHGSDRLDDRSNQETATRDSSIRGVRSHLGALREGTDEEDGDGDVRFPAAATELRRVSTQRAPNARGGQGRRRRGQVRCAGRRAKQEMKKRQNARRQPTPYSLNSSKEGAGVF